MAKEKRKVLVVERLLLHYRIPLYEQLRRELAGRDILLELLYGDGTPAEKSKKDDVRLEWARKIPTKYLFDGRICWQPYGEDARKADLVVVMHENKMLFNLWLMICDRPARLAFWGHGKNFQSRNPNGVKERFKRWTANKVDWWFAYTEDGARLVEAAGFPRERITVVNNASDTRLLAEQCASYAREGQSVLRRKYGLSDAPTGVFIGSLYADKRIDFLLDAARRIRAEIPDFQLLVCGAGPQEELVKAAARQHDWIRYLGISHDEAKARALAMSDLMLNPGLVGLGVLDSFASGKPMFTTDNAFHSPEICYLQHDHNGIIARNDVDSFSQAVITVLRAPASLKRLSASALECSTRYTIENMVERIVNGIVSCLGYPAFKG